MSRVLVACEYDGVVRDAFAPLGLEVREIAGFPGYVITSCGQVFSRNHPTGPLRWFKRLSPSSDAKGYMGLTLCAPEKRRKVRIHRLVAETFIPNSKGLPCVRHLNGVPTDNRAENLAWGTYADNEADKINHGTWDGRRNGKLSPADIHHIRSECAKGVPRKIVAAQLDVSTATVGRVINGKIWGNIPCAS